MTLFFALYSNLLAQPAPASPSTAEFVKAATQSDDFERQSGTIAETSGLTERVRSYAAMMVEDHTKTAQGLQGAIEQSGLSVRRDPDPTGNEIQMLNALNDNIGKPLFDRVYMRQQVKVHEQDLALMQAYAQNGDNQALRAAAANMAPIVQQHLAKAKEVNASLY
jgi:putative membrane protein